MRVRSPGSSSSAIGDASLIAHQALAALGGRSLGHSLAIESVLDLLGAGPCLLVLDNCEHLIEGCAMFARAVLHGTKTTSILASGDAGRDRWLARRFERDDLSSATGY